MARVLWGWVFFLGSPSRKTPQPLSATCFQSEFSTALLRQRTVKMYHLKTSRLVQKLPTGRALAFESCFKMLCKYTHLQKSSSCQPICSSPLQDKEWKRVSPAHGLIPILVLPSSPLNSSSKTGLEKHFLLRRERNCYQGHCCHTCTIEFLFCTSKPSLATLLYLIVPTKSNAEFQHLFHFFLSINKILFLWEWKNKQYM